MSKEAAVRKRLDLLAQAAQLIVGPPQKLVDETLNVVGTLSDARGTGVWVPENGDLAIFVARGGISSSAQKLINQTWSQHRQAFESGIPFFKTTESLVIALLPLKDDSGLRAVLYLESADLRFATDQGKQELVELATVLTKAVAKAFALLADPTSNAAWSTYLEQTPIEVIERAQLLGLLNRNEWNIARVARVLGVSRRTVYLRIERHKIERQHVLKSGRGRHKGGVPPRLAPAKG